jgi:hypothetical protein
MSTSARTGPGSTSRKTSSRSPGDREAEGSRADRPQGYGGNNQHTVGFENRHQGSAVERARRRGSPGTREGGLRGPDGQRRGTGSHNIDADYPGVTEIQPVGIFMDSHYNKIGGRDTPEF